MTRVLILQGQMKQYRAPLFARLRDLLLEDGVQLTVAYSDVWRCDVEKNDNCDLPPEYGLKVRGVWLWPEKLLYQSILKIARSSNLIIMPQENKYLANHLLLFLSWGGLRRIAFWGHGTNYQPNPLRMSEWYRRMTLDWVSWWFAYTTGTAKYLEAHGVPPSKITVLHNSVDTREIRERIRSTTSQDRAALRAKVGIPVTAPVGIFCGMLDRVKGLPLLIEASQIIKARIPEFHLILIGGGPEREEIERLIQGQRWVHWVGARFGKEKAELLAISDVFLLPGKVGLAILDAFAAGLPLVTIDFNSHAPEIEYLRHGVNGLISGADPEAFAETVASLFNRPAYLAHLKVGAGSSAEKYSIENMAENFRAGIRSCLELTQPTANFPGLQEST